MAPRKKSTSSKKKGNKQPKQRANLGASAQQTNAINNHADRHEQQAQPVVGNLQVLVPRQPDVDSVVLPSSSAVLLQKLVDMLYKKDAIPEEFQQKDKVVLTRRIKEIWFCNPNLILMPSMISAVLNNDFSQRLLIPGMDEPFTILISLCQYKLWHVVNGYVGGDDMAKM